MVGWKIDHHPLHSSINPHPSMAVDVCSEISSPRISFSHDLKEAVESHPSLLLNPTIDFHFDFCIGHQTLISSADELFANGKILPVQIKTPPKPTSNDVVQEDTTKKKRLIEFLSTTFDEEDEEEEEEEDHKQSTKTFWQFRRSNSVNSNGFIGRSLQFLTRSNSTGSVPNPSPKVMQKQHSLKESSINPHPGFHHHYYPYNSNNMNSSKKPYLRSSNSRSYVNGVGISPVLNITPTYIAKGTVSLFGIGSFFSGKKKSKKKRK